MKTGKDSKKVLYSGISLKRTLYKADSSIRRTVMLERIDLRLNSYRQVSIKRTVIKRTLYKADDFFCTK